MARLLRIAAAVVMTVACAAVPLVGDWCAASCEAARVAGLDAAPPCHHAAAPAARIGQQPSPCGQAHHAVVIEAAATIARAGGTMLSIVNASAPASASAAAPASYAGRAARIDRGPSRTSPLPLALAAALRI
jgi:hypothetical protein